MDVLVATSWRTTHPDARVGVLVLRNVVNPTQHDGLDARRAAVEEELRARFAGQTRAALQALDPVRAYAAFYKPFGKTYHVVLQLESVALKGKPLESASALLTAMFMAEVRTQLLTAGHDLDAVVPPLTVAAARGGETYVRITGQPQALKGDDLYMADARGIISSVIYGPDERTRITPATRHAMFVTYAPKGVGEGVVRRHLEELEASVRVVAPGATREILGIWGGPA